MHPLAMLLGIVMGSAVSITVALVLTLVVFMFLPEYADRIGDVVAIANEDWALTSERVDRIVSALRGQHGGLTDAEVLIPLRVAGAAAG